MLYYFFIIISLLGLIYLVGSIITFLSSIVLSDKYESFFVKLVSGLITLIILYSVFKTSGNTVNIILIIPLTFLLYYFKTKYNGDKEKNKRSFVQGFRNELGLFGLLCMYCLIWYIWQYSLYGSNVYADNSVAVSPYGDPVFYSDISISLKNSGAENLNTIKNTILNLSSERVPYHYFELWISAGVSSIFGINVLIAHLLITPVILFSLISILIFQLARHFKINKSVACITPALIFIGPHLINYPYLSDLIPENFKSYLGNYIYSYISLPKFLVAIFFLSGVIYFYTKGRDAFVFLLLMLPVISFLAFVSVMGFVFLFLVIRYINRQRGKDLYLMTTVSFLTFIFLVIYYRSSFLMQKPGNAEDFASLAHVKAGVRIIGATFLQVLYVYTPFFVLLYFFSRMFKMVSIVFSRANIQLYLYFGFAFMCGIIGWIILYQQPNLYQFFSYFFLSAMVALMGYQVLIILSGFHDGKIWIKGIFISVITGFLVYCAFWNTKNHKEIVLEKKTYSGSFFSEVKEVLDSKIKNKTGVGFFSKDDYIADPDLRNSMVHWPAQVFKIVDENFYVVSLTDMLQPEFTPGSIDYMRNEIIKRNTLFSTWLRVKDSSEIQSYDNIAPLQLKFIRENGIQFGIASADAIIPTQISILKGREIIDSISGYRFFLIKDNE